MKAPKALKARLKSALWWRREPDFFSACVSPEFVGLFGNEALEVLLTAYEFKSVLDIGSGAGRHAELLARHGKSVTKIDLGDSVAFSSDNRQVDVVRGDYLGHVFPDKFDCIWACHVLEHQRNVGAFLDKMHTDLKEGGVLAVTVPPSKDEIVDGHLSIWNAGLLLYNLVLAGFDCRDAAVKSYAYNVSALLRKKTIRLPKVHMDSGDIGRLEPFLPPGFHHSMDGVIKELNWPSVPR